MSLSESSAQPERTPPPRNDRPETARPPSESEAPPDEPLDADGLDIDALLPATFEAGAARVTMGLDLADLLRAAEERIEARGETSRPPGSMEEEGVNVPVPDDVLALLAEPLEGDDDENATGANLGGSSAGTGADRPGTSDGILATPHGETPHGVHGEEEDLEQQLPRAPDVVSREETAARALTGAGRADSSPPYMEAPRPPATTRPGPEDEHPFRPASDSLSPAAMPAARASDRGARRGPSEVPGAPSDRTASYDRGAASFDRGAASFDRGTASFDRGGAADDFESTAFERGAGPSHRGAVLDRSAARIERAAMAERGVETPRSMEEVRGGASERGTAADRSAMRTIEMRAIERPLPSDPGQRSAPRAAADPGPRSRAAHTDAVPAVLGPGDAARALGRAIANRVSGALLVTSGDDQRRIVLHDGDVVTAGSSAPVESLVAFLAARGDIDRDLVPRLAGKLPAFGRHAGAALVANGHLGQDDLWPVLRAHSEWVMGRALLVESGTCELEADPPARFKAEPSVFGGATGAEVFVDVMQRVTSPETALARLGGYGARMAQGPRSALLGECALAPEEEDAVRASPGRTVHELTGDGPTERWSMLYALVCLDVLEALPAVAREEKREASTVDPLDEEALRQRVRARLALVEEGDYFALLGVPRGATSYEIRRAYVDLRRQLSPSRVLTAGTADLADDLRLVLEVLEEAFEILRDANRRERYRRAIEGGPPAR